MQEKELIKGEFYNIKKWKKPIIIAIIVLSSILSCYAIIGNLKYYEWDTLLSLFLIIFTVTIVIICLVLFIFFWLSKMELIITDQRVYGKEAFGKRVDLPIDSISAVGTSFMKGITIGTSSGKVFFKLVKNNENIHKEVSKLLLKRQQNNKN